jgi:hypothetical protein
MAKTGGVPSSIGLDVREQFSMHWIMASWLKESSSLRSISLCHRCWIWSMKHEQDVHS